MLRLQWELSPPILMHLTLSHLFVLSDEGVYRLYDLSNPQTYTQHTLGSEVSDAGLVSAKAHDDGFVVLTGNLQFLEVRGWGGGRAVPLAEAGMSCVIAGAWISPAGVEGYERGLMLIQRPVRGASFLDPDSARAVIKRTCRIADLGRIHHHHSRRSRPDRSGRFNSGLVPANLMQIAHLPWTLQSRSGIT